jgi:type II restriction/modification system DNA methylase subunit YeeA
MPLSWYDFVNKWSASTLPEISGYAEHFLDLCNALGEPRPADLDQTGADYTFQKHVPKTLGGKGFADVFKRGHFIWEYKGDRKSLTGAYEQVLQYKEALDNPPLLVVSDFKRFEIHTQWVNTPKRVYKFELQDLLYHKPTENCPLPPTEVLAALFRDPEILQPHKMAERVTRDAAARFSELAERLELEGPHRLTAQGREEVARFLMRLLFCFFADSVGLLPNRLFRKMVEDWRGRPKQFLRALKGLFAAMSQKDSLYGPFSIHYFNGGLFMDDAVLEMTAADIGTLAALGELDWAHIEPAIFGTLFERSLVKEKRKLIGAHYTGVSDIRLVVGPVIETPLRRRWAEVQAEIDALAAQAEKINGSGRRGLHQQMDEKLAAWVRELAAVRVLDPACGSGNFLYVALKSLLDLWIEARNFATKHGLPPLAESPVSPRQLYGIEKDFFAHELASVAVWIGYLQWRFENSMGEPKEPILEKLDNIQLGDAVMRYDEKGKPYEPEWPEAEFIVGNPPFLGGNKVRHEMGDKYVDDLFALYGNRVPSFSDYVCYWFEKARAQIESDRSERAGLLATQGIRGGVNREVLRRIKGSGDIFLAHSDREWTLDGANVHISIIGFDDGTQTSRTLDDSGVTTINADLTTSADLTAAATLDENVRLWAYGSQRKGSFDITAEAARKLLASPRSFGKLISDVVRPSANGVQVLRSREHGWVIDFGENMSIEEAALYEAPFAYVERIVKPERESRSETRQRTHWWLHARPSPKYRAMLRQQSRCIGTPVTSKHRIFIWLTREVLADHAIVVFARDDDYFFGILHSRLHEVWARQLGTQLREFESGFRYTPTSTFETFPFPWPPGKEPKRDARVKAIASAAQALVEKRDNWLNPEDATPEELVKRTLTNLYNERPAWLEHLHARLDAAVFAAYGWPDTLTKDEILQKLLALNQQRALGASGADRGCSR